MMRLAPHPCPLPRVRGRGRKTRINSMTGLTAIVMCIFWCVVALLITGARGYSIGGIALCLIGILIGGGVAGWAGWYALTGWNVVVSTQNEKIAACAAV